jgi:hypothetical protein
MKHERKCVQVSIQSASPSTGTSRDAFEVVLNFRCAFVNAMSYHAESFVIELMVQKVRKNLKACAIAMKSSMERDVKA